MLKCDLCHAEIESVEAAIAADWSPSYFIGKHETCNPICAECSANRCQICDDGELELKPRSPIEPMALSEYGRYLPPKRLFDF